MLGRWWSRAPEPDPNWLADALLRASHEEGLGITIVLEHEGVPVRVFATEMAAEILGYSLDELVGAPVQEAYLPIDHAFLLEGGFWDDSKPRRLEKTAVRRDGTQIPVEVVSVAIDVRGRRARVGFIRSLAERNRLDAAVRASEARFRQLIEATPEAIAVQRGGCLVYGNPALSRLLGHESGELVGSRLVDFTHPDDLPIVYRRAKEMFDSKRAIEPVELRLRHRDGHYLWVEFFSIATEFDGAPAILGYARDISGRKELQAKVLEADRLATIGTLAAGVAHEINNPLAYSLLNLEILSSALSANEIPRGSMEELREAVRETLGGNRRIAAIVRDLTALSRTSDDIRTIDVRGVLESVVKIVMATAKRKTRLVTDFAASSWVRADAARLGQVFMNLLVNAVQALPERSENDNLVGVMLHDGPPGWTTIDVIDNGVGVPAELKERIFDPFFTTKPAGMGTGLGLSISKTIVASLGGTLSLEDRDGGGSKFSVALPATTPSVRPPAFNAVAPTGGDEAMKRPRVLVVDDDVALARVLGRALRDDHDVILAYSGREALEQLSDPREFDTILCDLNMLSMDGPALYQEIVKSRPGLAKRVIFMTGAPIVGEIAELMKRLNRPCLQKPVDLAIVRGSIQRVARRGADNLE